MLEDQGWGYLKRCEHTPLTKKPFRNGPPASTGWVNVSTRVPTTTICTRISTPLVGAIARRETETLSMALRTQTTNGCKARMYRTLAENTPARVGKGHANDPSRHWYPRSSPQRLPCTLGCFRLLLRYRVCLVYPRSAQNQALKQA